MARNGLSPSALERVREAVLPSGDIVRVRPLRGGISSSVHLVRLRAHDGAEEAVVVRRYGEYWLRVDPAACEREFRLLDWLANTGFPAPKPILLDREGGEFGAPTVVMSRLPGRPQCAPREVDDYLRQLAGTLAELHRLPSDALDFLPDQRDIVDRALASSKPTDDPLQEAVKRVVIATWPDAQASEQRRLVHGDYWPGNVLFRRNRLVGVVDWEQPRVGEPSKDVATCRGDLAVLFSLAEADRFVEYYREAGGQPLNNLRFWDLFICTWAVPSMPEWAVAYRVLKRPDLTSEVATAKIRAFAEAALSRDPER